MEPEEDLILRHERLVREAVARVLQARVPPSIEADDVAQAARLGLCEAARRWRPETGVPFDAFARPRVRGAAIDHLRANRFLAGVGRDAWEDGRCESLDAMIAAMHTSGGRWPGISFCIQPPNMARRLDGRLLRWVHRLPRRERLVVWAWVHDVPAATIMHRLGLPESTVHWLRRRGLAQLRRWAA